MSCKKWERQIYLYDDLSAGERKELEDHLLVCASCTAKMEIASHGIELIKRARRVEVKLERPELLTRRIMNDINSVTSIRRQSVFTVILDHLLTRYAFAAASFSLLIFFMVEQNTDLKLSRQVLRGSETVTLNSGSFLRTIRDNQKKKENHTVLTLSGCAKQEHCDNALVKNLKRRFKS